MKKAKIKRIYITILAWIIALILVYYVYIKARILLNF